jgi:beta-glucosidase/6-phospho-beta-glucosidase/beta-galactosidase
MHGSSNVVCIDCSDAFAEFGRLSFQLFGDRVKHWITFNEVHEFAIQGYSLGTLAPGRCSPAYGNCTAGNSSTEPYIVAHNCLKGHAEAVRIYRSEFKVIQY